LLRERRSSPAKFAPFYIPLQNFFHLRPIEAVVLEETPILSSNHCVLEVRRNPVQCNVNISFLISPMVNETLDSALNLHRGCWRIDPAQRENPSYARGIEYADRQANSREDQPKPSAPSRADRRKIASFAGYR
jgi:hypothetical protein